MRDEEIKEHGIIALWLRICNDYYSEYDTEQSINYEQLKEVGIILDTKKGEKDAN